MRSSLVAALGLGLSACATNAATPAPSALPALMSFAPEEGTLPEVQEDFGRLVGKWTCTGEQRQADGSFKEGPGEARWTFFYTLGAEAIGDVFEPPPGGGPVGINLRVYDPERKTWVLAWTTPTLRRYDHFEATREGETLVMRGSVPAQGPFPDHEAKITFFEMKAGSFEWKYDAAAQGTEGPWQTQSLLHCTASG